MVFKGKFWNFLRKVLNVTSIETNLILFKMYVNTVTEKSNGLIFEESYMKVTRTTSSYI